MSSSARSATSSRGTVPAGAGFAALVGAVICLALCAVFLTADAPWSLRSDNARYEFALTLEAYRAWSRFELPEWTDKLWAGYPLLADPTSKALYPPVHLAFLLTPEPHLYAYDLATAMHVGLLAAGSVRLVGLLGASRGASLVAVALTLASPGLPVDALSFLAVLAALAWWPWTFVAAEQLAHGAPARTGRAALLGSSALAAQVLGGYPEFALYSGVAAAAWLVTRRAGLPLAARLRRALVLGVGALALAAPQLLPTMDHLQDTLRATTPAAADVLSLGLDPWSLLFSAGPWIVPGHVFVGIATLVAALIAVWQRRPRALFLVVLALVALLLSTGPRTPLYGLLHALPGFHLFRNPFKFARLAHFALAWAAALALGPLRGGGRAAIAVAALAIAAVVEHGVATVAALPSYARLSPRPDVRGILALLAGAELENDPASGTPPPRLLELLDHGQTPFSASLGLVHGIAYVKGGAPPLLGARHHELLLFRDFDAASLDLLGVDLVLARRAQCSAFAVRWKLLVRLQQTATCVLTNPRRPGRYELISQARFVSSIDEMVALARTSPAGPPAVVAPSAPPLDPGAISPRGVAIESYAPGRVELRVHTPGAALLLVRDSWARGWAARVDGRDATIHPAAGIFFALPVATGSHHVALTHRAPGLRPGLAAAGAWLLGSALVALALRRRGRPYL